MGSIGISDRTAVDSPCHAEDAGVRRPHRTNDLGFRHGLSPAASAGDLLLRRWQIIPHQRQASALAASAGLAHDCCRAPQRIYEERNALLGYLWQNLDYRILKNVRARQRQM